MNNKPMHATAADYRSTLHTPWSVGAFVGFGAYGDHREILDRFGNRVCVVPELIAGEVVATANRRASDALECVQLGGGPYPLCQCYVCNAARQRKAVQG